MNNEDEQNAHVELRQLFEKAGEEPSDLQVARMLGKARAIPTAALERRPRWVWLPVGASAVLAAAAAGFWLLDMRGVQAGAEVGAQAASVLPEGTEHDVGERATPNALRVVGAGPATSEEEEALGEAAQVLNGPGFAEADEVALGAEHNWATTDAEASLLLVGDNADDAELGSGMGAEDLYGPLSEEDVDWWMLATNELLGGG